MCIKHVYIVEPKSKLQDGNYKIVDGVKTYIKVFRKTKYVSDYT